MDVKPRNLHGLGEKSTFTVLVTGANSGLGYAICCRLIDEFLHTRPQSESIHILFSTRSATKSAQTLKGLNAHLQKQLRDANGRVEGISRLLEARVKIEGVSVDLTKLCTVKALAEQLLRRGQRIDALVCNAGIGGWTGLHWLQATYSLVFDFMHASTFPTYQAGTLGATTGRQIDGHLEKADEPPLGEVFTANVFGHYMLAHWLAPLFNAESRIIWISSMTAHPQLFSADDIQRLKDTEAYESSKRLTDLLVLSSELPSTRPFVSDFLSTTPSAASSTTQIDNPRPKMYLTHPGIVHTSISGLPKILDLVIVAAFYLARWLGSPWHTVTAYTAAVSAVWACLAPDTQLPDRERREGKGKWGSVTGVSGDEYVKRTEVDGWGFCGEVGVVPSGSVSGKTGRYRGRREVTQERREEFEDTARHVWRELEEMRVAWEKRLGPVHISDSEDV